MTTWEWIKKAFGLPTVVSDGWADEDFVRRAADAIVQEIDWDSMDGGRLHRATSKAKAKSGKTVIVGVLDDVAKLDALLRDAEEERQDSALSADIEVWVYIPQNLRIAAVTSGIILKPIPAA